METSSNGFSRPTFRHFRDSRRSAAVGEKGQIGFVVNSDFLAQVLFVL
jgi:hypothetical protein